MDRCTVGQRPEATCPACGDTVAGAAMEAHVQKCLQRFSKAPRTTNTDACICVVCRKDITALDEARRLAHVNRCLDGEAEEPLQEPVVSTPSRNGAPGFVLLDCPLCERSFKTSEACKNHIKQCSTKLGMSPKQVIEAIRLQQRYVQERMAAGLPVVRRRRNVPTDASTAQRPAKKPRPVASVPKSKYQEEVQMARALSASLSSAASKEQQEAQRRFCELLGGSHSAARKRKHATKETPVLLLTSAEERAQKVEEKIERLLTQRMIGLELGDLSWCTKLKTVGKLSDRIRELSSKDAPLWSLAGQQRERQEDYYVCSLCHVVTPSAVEVGSRLKSLTQVPGRRLSGDLNIVNDLGTAKPRSSLLDGGDEKQLTTQAHRDGLLSALDAVLPPTRARLDDTQLEGRDSTEAGHGFLTQENEESSVAKPASLVAPAAKQLLQDLDSLVGYRKFSDIRIIAEDGCVIPAHRVILLTRCPAVEKEVSRQGDRVPLLDWTARSKGCVLAFLHYVYSGTLNLDGEDRRLHLELRGMAFRYNMTELCEELKDRYFRSEHEQGDSSGDEADTSLHEIITSFWDDGNEEMGQKEEFAENDNVESLEEVCEFLSSQHSQKNEGAGSCKKGDEQMDEDSAVPLSRPSLEHTIRPASRTQLDQGSANEGGPATLQPERKRPGTPYRVPLPVSPIQSEEEHAWTDAGSKEGDHHHAFNEEEEEEEESREAYHLQSGAGLAHDGNDSSSEELFGESGNSQASVDNSADEEEEGSEAGERGVSPQRESKRDAKYEEALSPNEEGSQGSGEKCKDTDDVWDCVWDGFDDGGGGAGQCPAPELNASALDRQGCPTQRSSESFTGIQAPGEEELPHEMLDSFFFEEQKGNGAAAHGSQAQSPWPAAAQSPAGSGRFLAPVTPLPDYATMHTPELRDQLQRFGVRRLPRSKAVNVLNRIYDETHPLVPETPPRPVPSRQEVNAGDRREYRKEQSARSSPSEWFPGSGTADEEPYRYHVSSSSGEDGDSDSSDAGINEQLGNFFKRNAELLESVLTYEPIDFQNLRLSLKEANIRISSKSLINYLDEQCITFTMPRSEKQQVKQRKRQQNFRRRLLGKQGPTGSTEHSSP